jgi:hypothetical protein
MVEKPTLKPPLTNDTEENIDNTTTVNTKSEASTTASEPFSDFPLLVDLRLVFEHLY